MKMIFKPRKHPYLARVGIFLIAVALVMGGLSCTYNLTMTAIPGAAGSPSPGSGSRAPGAVTINANPSGDYQFAYWTATAGTFTYPNNQPNNIFNQPTQDANVTVTAYFVKKLDHFTCYWIENQVLDMDAVQLQDQFGTYNATVGQALTFCNPATKWYNNVDTPVFHPDYHLTWYTLASYEGAVQNRVVTVVNQFGVQELTVSSLVGLAVPTWKLDPGNHSAPVGLDHFLLYGLTEPPSLNVTVRLHDEFGTYDQVLVYRVAALAVPVMKIHGNNKTDIQNPEAHLVFYQVEPQNYTGQVQIVNQFNAVNFTLQNLLYLAVPTQKLSSEPIP